MFSPFQFTVNASTASEPGFQLWLLNWCLPIVKTCKMIDRVRAPGSIKLPEDYRVQLPVVIVDYMAKQVCTLIELPRTPFGFQTGVVLH